MSQVIPNDGHLEHDGGGVDGDEDQGGEDHLGVAGLEAVQHQGAEHHGLKKNVGNSKAVPSYKWGNSMVVIPSPRNHPEYGPDPGYCCCCL